MSKFEIYTLSSAYADGHDFDAGFNMTSGDFLERTSYAERLGSISTDALFNGREYDDIGREQEERLGKGTWIDPDKYTRGVCDLYSIEGKPIDFHEIANNMAENNLFGVMLSIDEYESDGDFIMEMKEWIQDSTKIQEYGGDNEAWVYDNLPTKDFKFTGHLDEENTDVTGEFDSCFFETVDEGLIFILVPNGKIEFHENNEVKQ